MNDRLKELHNQSQKENDRLQELHNQSLEELHNQSQGQPQQSQPPPAQALVLREEGDEGALARWDEATVAKSNFDLAHRDQAALVTRAMATADMRTRSCVGQIIEIVGFVAHGAELTDSETGEVTRKIRVVMILADGRTVSTMSKACVRALQALSRCMPVGRWEPPVKIEIREHPMEGGKSYCDLRVVENPGGSQTRPAAKGGVK